MLRRATKAEGSAEASADRVGPAHVLVVNDDENACELLVRLLARAGHTVERAHNADQAFGHLNVGRVDCVVLDLTTGGIGQNLKVVDTIRTAMPRSIAGVRVVLVSQQSSNRMFSWQSGIDAFIAHPFHADEFVAQVNEVLARPDAERERHRRSELDTVSTEGRSGVARPWTPAEDDEGSN